MPEPSKQTKVLKKKSENVTMQTDDFVRVPRSVWLQILAELNAMKRNGGRLKTLTAKLEKIK